MTLHAVSFNMLNQAELYFYLKRMNKCSMQCSSTLLQGVLMKKEKSKIFVYGDQGLSLERILTVINKKSMNLVSWQCLLDTELSIL